MFRGMTEFVCNDCGHKFVGMDCEYQATVYTAPVKCPKCGSWHTLPSGSFLGQLKTVYRDIWKSIDKYHNDINR